MSLVGPLTIEGVAHGGDGLARNGGKAVFVRGAVPGDVVMVSITEGKARFDRAEPAEILQPSAHRVVAPCPVFGVCGGCTWQMATWSAQLAWKAEVVRSQLEHLGRLEVEVLEPIAPSDPYRYRNRVDLRVFRGSAAMLAAGSHDSVAIEDCLLAVDAIGEFVRGHDWASARGKVTLRAGSEGVVAIGSGPRLLDVREAVVHHEVGGHRFRVSGRTFFQVNTAGAEELVRLMLQALGRLQPTDRLVDGYAGGGLFAAVLAARVGSVSAVESDRFSVADLAINAPDVSIVSHRMERAFEHLAPAADLIVVDPPRQGLGAVVVEGLVRLGARAIAYVSCDPASFARDARLLVDAGYTLDWVQPVDMFPQTPHIETVSRFSR